MLENDSPFPHLFIWYVAPDGIEPILRLWLKEVEAKLGVKGELFLRRDRDKEGKPRTTFMETYREVDEPFIATLEAMACQQPWHTQLISPRRCEAFNRIE
jgi:hypothetical protein